MKLLLALAALLMAVATLAYLRHGAREYAQPAEDPGFDPNVTARPDWSWTRSNATGLNAGPWSWTVA